MQASKPALTLWQFEHYSTEVCMLYDECKAKFASFRDYGPSLETSVHAFNAG